MSTRAATHYELIGLSREATPEEIKSAFRAQAQIHHPDAGGDTEAFTALSAAYEVLTDPDRRADYDATLPAEGASRFGGWARPTSDPAPPAPVSDAAEAEPTERRRPVSEVDGDDPAVFRRTSERSSFREEALPESERGDVGLGAVDAAEVRAMSSSNQTDQGASDEGPVEQDASDDLQRGVDGSSPAGRRRSDDEEEDTGGAIRREGREDRDEEVVPTPGDRPLGGRSDDGEKDKIRSNREGTEEEKEERDNSNPAKEDSDPAPSKRSRASSNPWDVDSDPRRRY